MGSPNHFLCLEDRDCDALLRVLARARAIAGDQAAVYRAREHVAAGRVVVRGDAEEDVLLQIASASSVPVLVGGSTIGDPVQVLADVLTAEDHFGFSSVSVAFFGDARVGLGRSYVEASPLLKLSLNIVPPPGAPSPATGSRAWVTSAARDAMRGAQLVVGAPALPALSDAARAVVAKGAVFVNELAERARNRAAVEEALVEDALATTLPRRLAAWRATRLTERFAISGALLRIAGEHLARDEASCGGTVARKPSVEVFASWRSGDGLTVSLVFDHRLDVFAQSGSDWGNHHVRTADATFAGATLVRWAETSTVKHDVPERGSSDYDDRALARAVRDAAIVKLGEVSPAELPSASRSSTARLPEPSSPVAPRADECVCVRAQDGKRFLDATDSVDGAEMHQVVAGCELVSETPETCTSRYRCRVCRTEWVQEMWDSGPMTWMFLRPSTMARER